MEKTYASYNMKNLSIIIVITFLFSCGKQEKTEQRTTAANTSLSYTVLTTLPHDAEAFTEGLEIYDNKILESTGRNGASWVAETDPGSGKHDKKVTLSNEYFGEGITVLHNKLYHLTYTTRVGFIYNANTYQKTGQFNYDPMIKEGWGLTHDASHLIVSDGTDKIHFVDTIDFKVVKSITVKEGQTPIKQINELEYVNGRIYANVWQTALILVIDAETGRVTGKIDLSSIVNKINAMYPHANELNGIAYDKNANALLITGKNWPESYLIRVK